MQNGYAVQEMEAVYRKKIQGYIDKNRTLTADAVVDISVDLFHEIKAENVAAGQEDDMLLFQYGTYNWGDANGEHASFNITRQLRLQDEDEFYQLSFSLIYEPASLNGIEAYNCWSVDFDTLKAWITNIKASPGYQKLIQTHYRSYEF